MKLSIENVKRLCRSAMGPPTRELTETERKEMWTILSTMRPISESDNQHVMTEVYIVSGKEYHVHYGIYDYPVIEEILHDEQ